MFGGERVPQHVQNIVLRDYARRKDLTYLLAAVEYTMPQCFQMLSSILDELPGLDGILAYSLFMLPRDSEARALVYQRILEAGKVMHFAVEDMVVACPNDVSRIEDIWGVKTLLDASEKNQSRSDDK